MDRSNIAISALSNKSREVNLMLPAYAEVVIEAGGLPIILPTITDEVEIKAFANKYDGFIITGGEDINPKFYGKEKKEYCKDINEERDIFEKALIEEILKLDKPILAIGRGHQILNVALGGTLYQDIKIDKINNGIEIIHKQGEPLDKATHKLILNKDSSLYNILKKEYIEVNSIHHQGIKTLGKGLKEGATSEDGIIESIYMDGQKFVLGVQWHPEILFKTYPEQFNIFKEFIKYSKDKKVK